ncbi:hypothetical protein NDU88_003337 [Pleurodeles waltl]|uniref:Uncharacterized protein n=1 Tax=Pleurodeles waltl TaxID=8319 RepID=A0AAV7QEM2_PLEWA|nr:hypothetical protein NDU88_003337 [Pleurodeles waltl]
MVAKILNFKDYDTVLRAARERAPIHIENVRVSLFPDYTVAVQHRCSSFQEVKASSTDICSLTQGDPRLTDYAFKDCDTVLRAARERAPIHIENVRVSLFPDYTVAVQHRCSSFQEVMDAARGRYPLTDSVRQAFGTLGWDYMIVALTKFGIPADYIKWVKLLYSTPKARARTGPYISDSYQIPWGTRQSFPLASVCASRQTYCTANPTSSC